ncbi:MAG: hypothetical protein AB1505_15085 [Candidatus Latescibacterota bacterium]
MLSFLSRRKRAERTFNARLEIDRLTELSPPSTLVTLVKEGENVEAGEDLGKAFFLRREKKLYSEGEHLYITTPDNLKIARDQEMNAKRVSLQFFNRRVPYRVECQIVGRFRLLPEVVETLDFGAKAAYKLALVSGLRKQDKRQFYRYTLKNYGDSRVPLTTHVTFDLYVKATNKEFPDEGAPPALLADLYVVPQKERGSSEPFSTRDAISHFREIMLRKPPHERSVHVTKVIREESSGMARRKDEILLLGDTNILGLEMESLRDVLYLKKSQKAGLQKGRENPYNLHPGERILTHFVHDRKYYQMLCEVMEARTQNEVVRPLERPNEESGLRTELVDYSVGGVLVESSPELLRLLLGKRCPGSVEHEADFGSSYWTKLFEELRSPMLQLSFYPKLYFPDAVKRFRPELPFKISVLAQIVRTSKQVRGERHVLQHGLQFAYEPQGLPLRQDDPVDWRYTRYVRDNEYFKRVHSQLSTLYGYLENQSLSSGAMGVRRSATKEA